MAATTTTTTHKLLQTQLNRYVKLTGLAPLDVDGQIGRGTATATKAALNEILQLSAPHLSGGAAAWRDYHQFAWNYINTVDVSAPATVAAQAYALADLFQKFGNFNGSPILKDVVTPPMHPPPPPALTPPGTPPPQQQQPPSAQPPLVPASALLPPGTPPFFATSVNVFGKAVPAWLLYGAGAALVLGLGALVLTKPKPTAPTV
jgi:hypothetical protein